MFVCAVFPRLSIELRAYVKCFESLGRRGQVLCPTQKLEGGRWALLIKKNFFYSGSGRIR